MVDFSFRFSAKDNKFIFFVISSLLLLVVILVILLIFSHRSQTIVFGGGTPVFTEKHEQHQQQKDNSRNLQTSEEEKKIIKKIYDIISNPNDIEDPEILKQLRVPSGSNMVYKVYKWISDLPTDERGENSLSHDLKVAIGDLLWFFQERDIEDSYLGDCNIYGKDDWKTNSWAGYYQHFVPTVGCDTVYRAGLMGDGGKHLCNVHKIMKENLEKKETCMVYSFGSNDDISFDDQMHYVLGCKAHAFDPTISKHVIDSQLSEYVTFHKLGIGPDLESFQYRDSSKTLTEIAAELGTKKVDILKVDIEGNETPVFDNIFNKEDGILKKLGVKIILVEYHAHSATHKEKYDCHNRKKYLYPFIKDFYDNGYYMYRFEHNVFGVTCIEYGFISKDMI